MTTPSPFAETDPAGEPGVAPAPPPGVRVWRGDLVESIHAVHAAVADRQGRLLAAHGDPSARAYLRSAAKPIQALPLVEEGIADRYGLTAAEIAIACASHGAEPDHLEAVRRILEKGDLEPDLLQCGPHPPLHEPTARAMLRRGEEPGRLHNNCSGKHAGMLLVCRAMGWPLEAYRDPRHPLQRRILATLAELAGLAPHAIAIAVDGCGAPTFGLPVAAMAAAWGRLAGADAARANDRDRAIGVVLDAMATHPRLVAGTGRLCTDLMRRAGGRVVAKTGAEGVYCAALRDEPRGLALKVADGARRAQDVALVALLAGLGAVDPADPELAGHAAPVVENRAGATVGRIDASLPLVEVG